ncbi:hypothetical protein PMm318_A12370 [Pseudomonas moorei]|jgi:hypothetical protein
MSVGLRTLAAAPLLGGLTSVMAAKDAHRFRGKPDQGMQDLVMEHLKKDPHLYRI